MMKTYTMVWVWTACLMTACNEQHYLQQGLPYKHTLHVQQDSITIVTAVRGGGRTISYDPGMTYATYRLNRIFHIQGGGSGTPIHGEYREQYPNKYPKCAGKYHDGLKDGQWREWDPDGVLRKVSNWERGIERGEEVLFDTAGKIVRKGGRRNGQLHGLVKVYHYGDSSYTEKKYYRNGREIPKGRLWNRVIAWL